MLSLVVEAHRQTKLASKGKDITILDLSKSELSIKGTVEERLIEVENAKDVLGVKYREILNFPNCFFLNTKQNEDAIIEVVRKYQPDMVFIPYTLPDIRTTKIRQKLYETLC